MILEVDGKAFLIDKETSFFYQRMNEDAPWQFGIKNDGTPCSIIRDSYDENEVEELYKKIQKALKRGETVMKIGD